MMGFEEATVPVLVNLQAAVEAVHAKWFDGDAAEAGAVLVTGAGAAADPGPIGMQIIEAACSGGRRAELFVQWWGGDYSAWKDDPSDGDWFGANEAAYQLIQLGLDSPNAPADLEQALRAGPWREKWDSPRPGKDDDGKPIRTTILGLLIGRALKRQRKRFESIGRIQFRRAGPDATDEEASPAPAPPETPEQEIIRLRHELAQARAVNAVQMTVVRNERAARSAAEAGKRAADELVRAMFETLALPDEQMTARTKLVSLVLAREAASRNSRGIFNLSNAALAELTGLSEKVVSEIMQDLNARDGTPFERIVTRVDIEVAPGITEPRSIAQVRITTADQSTISVVRALPGMGGPSDKEMQRKAKARARATAAAEARIAAEVGKRIGWGWCSAHEDVDVTVKGHCSQCGEVVGERMMTADEFRILNPEIQDSASQPPLPVDVVTLPAALRDSAPPPSLLNYAASQPREWPDRCPAPGCTALGFRALPDGSWRCLKSGHDPSAYPLAAVAGGSGE